MMYATYAGRTILQLLFTVLAFVLAPLLALTCDKDGFLPEWLCWFETFDSPSCDTGWHDGYFAVSDIPTGLTLWWLRVRWLWRNPAYGFCYWPMGLAYEPSDWVIDVLQTSGTTIVYMKAHTKDGRHFCLTTSSGWKLGYKLWWALGPDWKLRDEMLLSQGPDNRLPLCFTPR